MTTLTGQRRDPDVVFRWAGIALYAVSIPLWSLAIAFRPPALLEMSTAAVALSTVALVGLFVVVEAFPLQVENARNTILITFSELPLVIGLLTLPLPAVLVGSMSSVLLVYVVRRDKLRHVIVNSSFVCFETSIAAIGFVAMSAIFGANLVVAMLAVLIVLPLGTLSSAVIVGELHRLTDGRRDPFLRNVMRSISTALVTTVMAIVGRVLAAGGAVGLVACVGLAGVIVVVYRAHSKSLRRQHDYRRFRDIIHEIPTLAPNVDLWPVLLEHVREQFNAQAAIILPSPQSPLTRPLTAVPAGETEHVHLPAPEDDELLVKAPVFVRLDTTGRDEFLLEQRQARQVLLVRIELADTFLGWLEVREPRTRWGSHGDDDLQMLSDVAQQIVVHWIVGQMTHTGITGA